MHIISWKPEGRYCRSKMFHWEPEGRYRHRLCTVIAAIWFSSLNGTSLNIDSALLALNTWYMEAQFAIIGSHEQNINYQYLYSLCMQNVLLYQARWRQTNLNCPEHTLVTWNMGIHLYWWTVLVRRNLVPERHSPSFPIYWHTPLLVPPWLLRGRSWRTSAESCSRLDRVLKRSRPDRSSGPCRIFPWSPRFSCSRRPWRCGWGVGERLATRTGPGVPGPW